MALGLATAAIILIAWPIYQIVSLIRSLPWGGERELALIAVMSCVLFLFAVIAPGVFSALDRTHPSALLQLLDVRAAAVQSSGFVGPFDGLRAAPFLLGDRDLSSQIWILDLVLVLLTFSVFAAGARISGVFGGVTAILFLPMDERMREALRSFDAVPALLAAVAVAATTLIAWRKGAFPLLWLGAGSVILLGAIFAAGYPVGQFGEISLLHGKASIFPCAILGLFGGPALRWWSKGLRSQPIDWQSFNAAMALLGIAALAGVAFLDWHRVPAFSYLALHLLAAILAGGVVGGLLRMLQCHPLAAPAVVIALSIVRLSIIPFEAKRIGGFASTIDDLKAVVPPAVQLGSSIDPVLAAEFLGRPVSRIRSILERGAGPLEAPFVLETRFATKLELEQISQRFRLVPILPGVSWAYNLGEAQAAPAASQ